MIETGSMPNADALEKARSEFLKLLSTSESATKLPQLQRFLRVEAVELIRAINNGKAGLTEAVTKRHRERFELVAEELLQYLKSTGTSKPKFWEQSI